MSFEPPIFVDFNPSAKDFLPKNQNRDRKEIVKDEGDLKDAWKEGRMHEGSWKREEEVIINSLERKRRKGYYSMARRRKGIKTNQNSPVQSLTEI